MSIIWEGESKPSEDLLKKEQSQEMPKQPVQNEPSEDDKAGNPEDHRQEMEERR